MPWPVSRNAHARAAMPCILLVLAALAGCSEPVAVDPAADPFAAVEPADPPPIVPGTEPLDEEDLAEIDAENAKKKAEQFKEMDRKARGMMKSFRSRAYDPLRDAGLLRLRGTATLETPAVTATYAIAFDGTKEPDEQVDVEPTAEPPGTPSGALRQVLRYANQSLRGGYQTVAYYFPPVPMLFTRAVDGAPLVTAQRWKADVQVTYRLDEREVVIARGAKTPRGHEVVEFEWRFYRGRYLLERATYKGTTAVIEYEYGESNGVVLLTKATLVRGASQVAVSFEYEDVEKGEPETPLTPVIVEPDEPDEPDERPR